MIKQTNNDIMDMFCNYLNMCYGDSSKARLLIEKEYGPFSKKMETIWKTLFN